MEDTHCKECIKAGSPINCQCPVHAQERDELRAMCDELADGMKSIHSKLGSTRFHQDDYSDKQIGDARCLAGCLVDKYKAMTASEDCESCVSKPTYNGCEGCQPDKG